MKKEELRIGNLIKIDGIVVAIDARTLLDWDVDNRKKEPIELNENWLVSFGFDKVLELNTYYNLHPLQLFSSPNGFEYLHTQLGGKFVIINHVHQLQNLYFSLGQKDIKSK